MDMDIFISMGSGFLEVIELFDSIQSLQLDGTINHDLEKSWDFHFCF